MGWAKGQALFVLIFALSGMIVYNRLYEPDDDTTNISKRAAVFENAWAGQ